MSDIVLAAATWTSLLATARRTKARADAFAALLPVNSTIELHDGSGLIRAITTGAWTVGSVQSDGQYPIIPGVFTDPATGAGTPTLAIIKNALGVEVCRLPAGVGAGIGFRLANALVAATPIARGAFTLLYATDDIPVIEVPPVPPDEPPVVPPIVEGWVDTIISDMELFHDGPTRTLQWISTWGSNWGWPTSYAKPPDWTTVGGWGVIIADYNGAGTPPPGWRVAGPYTGNTAPNTRAQVRDLQWWWLLPDGTWQRGSYNALPGGYMYHSSWQGEQYTSENAFRDESANGGGRSARYVNMNGPNPPAHQFNEWHWHFFGSRMNVPASYLGFVSCFFTRKILDNPNGADDRANARLLVDVAGDWWVTPTAQWAGNGVNNRPTGYNRFKYLTNNWQLVAHTSLPAAQIRSNPPPLIGL